MKKSLAIAAVVLWAGVLGYGQVHLEISGFGGYNAGLGFPTAMTVDSGFQTKTSTWTAEWRPFFNSAVLEQTGGILFGGRVGLQVTSLLGFEGGLEYSQAQFQFNPTVLTALQNKMTSLGFADTLTYVAKGGHILRFYGNVVLTIPLPGPVQPYLTAGLGSTSFTVLPSILGDRGALELLDLHYENISALTFNGGGGIKFFFGDRIGLRIDGRIFLGSPQFKQSFYHRLGMTTDVAQGDWVSQGGSHMDASLSAGLFIRLI